MNDINARYHPAAFPVFLRRPAIREGMKGMPVEVGACWGRTDVATGTILAVFAILCFEHV